MITSMYWALSVPVGFGWTFAQRFISLFLQIKAGVPLNNAQGRDQPMSKEVAMKDADGYARRAYLAHCNSWEAMILWTSSVLMAKVMGVEEATMNKAALIWMGARFMFTPAYILIKSHKAAFIRTVFFTVGSSSSFYLLWAAAKKA